jgi:hypothetical protein
LQRALDSSGIVRNRLQPSHFRSHPDRLGVRCVDRGTESQP